MVRDLLWWYMVENNHRMVCMSGLRTGRRKYYDLFSHFYDAFIRLHARSDEDDTRHFLVDEPRLEDKPTHLIFGYLLRNRIGDLFPGLL
jgi:hypothetical protein